MLNNVLVLRDAALRYAHQANDTAIEQSRMRLLGALAALVAHAQLVVCNDTGISHVAAAMRTPSTVIASGSDTRRWAPLDRERHRVLADYPPCRPCAFRDCPYDHSCALNVSVAEVVDMAVAQLAARRQAHPAAPTVLHTRSMHCHSLEPRHAT